MAAVKEDDKNMDFKKIAAGLFWLAVIFMALPMVFRIVGRSWNETKDNPIVHGTSGVLNDWAKTALGNTGSGSGFGGFGSSGSPDDLVKAVADSEAATIAARKKITTQKRFHEQRALELAGAEKEIGTTVEWHPRIKWKDVNSATPGAPIAVSVDVYRCDPALVTRNNNPAGVASTVATFLAKRGDPPSSLAGNVSLMDGVQYAFQAFVPNSDDEASVLIGPYTFIKGRGWQSPSGGKSFQEDLELWVNK